MTKALALPEIGVTLLQCWQIDGPRSPQTRIFDERDLFRPFGCCCKRSKNGPGRSVVAFRRAEGEQVPPVKCFGFVQTYDKKPRCRLWKLMKSQGMQENQQVVFMSDGGEDVRRVKEYLHQQRTSDRLVPHHDAADGSAAADQVFPR